MKFVIIYLLKFNSILIVGSYKEATFKLQRLEDEQDIMTADSEVDAPTRTANMVETIKRKNLQKNLELQKNKLNSVNNDCHKENVNTVNTNSSKQSCTKKVEVHSEISLKSLVKVPSSTDTKKKITCRTNVTNISR